MKEKIVSFRGMVRGDTLDDFKTAYDALVAALENGEQNLTLHSDRYIPARLSAFTTDYDPTSLSRYCFVAFDMIAETPFWLSATQYTDTWSSPADGNTRAINAGGGDVDALPIFAITAGGTGTLDIGLAVTVHGIARSFTLNGAVTSGDVLLVDTALEQVTLQATGADKMSLFDGEFLKLGIGSNTLTLTSPSGVSVSQIVTSWRRRWQ